MLFTKVESKFQLLLPACSASILNNKSIIADIGSGTGISTELFLKQGSVVYGVEPNKEMRQAAERLLKEYENYN